MNPAVDDFVNRCRERRIRLFVWWGRSSALGRDCVCYSGLLDQCERAENAGIPWQTTVATGEQCCYVFPRHPDAVET